MLVYPREHPMHISPHRLSLPGLTPASPASKAHSEPTDFNDMAGVAEDLKIGERRGSLARRPRQRTPEQKNRDERDDESAASGGAENSSPIIAVSFPARLASFDLTRLTAPAAELGCASRKDANGAST